MKAFWWYLSFIKSIVAWCLSRVKPWILCNLCFRSGKYSGWTKSFSSVRDGQQTTLRFISLKLSNIGDFDMTKCVGIQVCHVNFRIQEVIIITIIGNDSVVPLYHSIRLGMLRSYSALLYSQHRLSLRTCQNALRRGYHEIPLAHSVYMLYVVQFGIVRNKLENFVKLHSRIRYCW